MHCFTNIAFDSQQHKGTSGKCSNIEVEHEMNLKMEIMSSVVMSLANM